MNMSRALLDEWTRRGRLEGAKSGRPDSIEQEPHKNENEINCIAISPSQFVDMLSLQGNY